MIEPINMRRVPSGMCVTCRVMLQALNCAHLNFDTCFILTETERNACNDMKICDKLIESDEETQPLILLY